MEPTPNKAIKIRLIELGLTARATAKRARIHEARFSAIANGRINPNVAEQKRIARALNTTAAHLFGSEVAA
jgi:transcriptional regulator with XRE-family HTH domain